MVPMIGSAPPSTRSYGEIVDLGGERQRCRTFERNA